MSFLEAIILLGDHLDRHCRTPTPRLDEAEGGVGGHLCWYADGVVDLWFRTVF